MNPDELPEELKNLLNSPLAKSVVAWAEQRELAKRLTKDYKAGKKLLQKALLNQFKLGRELVNIREQIGEAQFRKWMETMCPKIPIEDALFFMDKALDSDLARHVDRAADGG